MKQIFIKQKGFSLVEMLVYIAVLVFMLAIIMNVTVSVVASQRLISSERNVDLSSMALLDRISREVRQATSIDTLSSIFGSNPGRLVLQSEDASGNPRTVEFFLTSGVVHVKENGVDVGALTRSSAKVTNLVFNHFLNSGADGVRTEITIESGTSTNYRSSKFYSSTIIR